MNDFFARPFRRRYDRRRAWARPRTANGEAPLGAGSGGGDAVDGSQTIYFQGNWTTCAGDVFLYAETHTKGGTPLGEDNPTLALCAVSDGARGRASLRGNQGVRITSGPPSEPIIGNGSINGVEIQVGETQEIKIFRGLDEGADESIELDKGSISLYTGTGNISILAAAEIKLSVAGGATSITLTPTGIVMQGPMIQIN